MKEDINKQKNNNQNFTKKPDTILNKNGKEFRTVKVETQKKEKKPNGFTKTVLVPFVCGVAGAGVVMGTCFGVPGIRNKILNIKTTATTSSSLSTTSSPTTDFISVTQYSDTAVGVAQKVLPSIVGIKVE